MATDLNALFARAEAASRAARWDAARADVHAVLGGVGDHPAAALHLLALVEQNAGRLPPARAMFGRALAVAPDDAQINNNYADQLDAAEDYDAALCHCDRAIRNAPEFLDAHGELHGDCFNKQVIGQSATVKAVSAAVRRARAGLQDPNRPLGSFLFLGPTGVGKTELTKALAKFLFDDSAAMVRIDMSEFMEKHAVSRLIGAPPGYVGYDEGGVLTEAVRRRPYQVILFDEVEKAHPDVFNILLQVLDDGRLTDGQGRTVDFTNTIIVLTSNLGSQYIAGLRDDQAVSEVEAQVMEIVRGHFRPEFLNRLDEIVLFSRLAMADMGAIVDIQLLRVQAMLGDRKIGLDLTDAARRWLARVGYDPVYGARPLKRAVQRFVQDPLADLILSGDVPDGSTVHVDEGDGKLALSAGYEA